MLTKDIQLPGSGKATYTVPGQYKYVTIMNDQDYSFTLYAGTNNTAENKIAVIPPYCHLPIPLVARNQQQQYTLAWTGTATGQITVIFSEESLGVGQTLTPSNGLTRVQIGTGNTMEGNTDKNNDYQDNVSKSNDIQGLTIANLTVAEYLDVVNKAVNVKLTGSNAPLPYKEENIILDPNPVKVSVLNGTTYISSTKNVGGYRYISAGIHLVANTGGNISFILMHHMQASYVADSITLAAATLLGNISDKLIKSNNITFRLTNNSGSTVEIDKLTYFAQ